MRLRHRGYLSIKVEHGTIGDIVKNKRKCLPKKIVAERRVGVMRYTRVLSLDSIV